MIVKKIPVNIDKFRPSNIHISLIENRGKFLKVKRAKNKKMEVVKASTDVTEKQEEVNLESGEQTQKVEEKLKRNSLSKFFRFKSMENLTAEGNSKVTKTNTLMRMFTKKDKKPEKDEKDKEIGSKATTRSSFLMRGLVAPWISHQPSQMDLRKPLEVATADDDDEALQEIATKSEIF